MHRALVKTLGMPKGVPQFKVPIFCTHPRENPAPHHVVRQLFSSTYRDNRKLWDSAIVGPDFDVQEFWEEATRDEPTVSTILRTIRNILTI